MGAGSVHSDGESIALKRHPGANTPKIFDHSDPQFGALDPFPKWKVAGARGPATGWRADAWLGSPALAANPRLAWSGNRTVILDLTI